MGIILLLKFGSGFKNRNITIKAMGGALMEVDDSLPLYDPEFWRIL
jgi:hypothetical protein